MRKVSCILLAVVAFLGLQAAANSATLQAGWYVDTGMVGFWWYDASGGGEPSGANGYFSTPVGTYGPFQVADYGSVPNARALGHCRQHHHGEQRGQPRPAVYHGVRGWLQVGLYGFRLLHGLRPVTDVREPVAGHERRNRRMPVVANARRGAERRVLGHAAACPQPKLLLPSYRCPGAVWLWRLWLRAFARRPSGRSGDPRPLAS